MIKLTLQTLCISLLSWGLSPALMAQICQPDTTITTPGIYPDSLPDACTFAPYAATITLVVPEDSTIGPPIVPFPITVQIDSLVIDDVFGLPAGLSYQCGSPNCTFLGNSTSCVLISGTPMLADTFSIDIATTAHVNTVLGPIPFSDTLVGFFTLIVKPGAGFTLTPNVATCGGSDGSAIATPLMAGLYDYLWSDGQTDSIATNLSAGPYSVTLTASNGCMSTQDFNLGTTGPNPDLGLDTTIFAGCAGDSGWSASITTMGGMMPYTYIWSNGDTTEDLNGVPAGTYDLRVDDANGCVDFLSIELDPVAPLVLGITGTDVSCGGAMDGSVTANISGGNPAYNIDWNLAGNPDSLNLSGLSGGTYALVVTDATGCVEDISITLQEPDSLMLDFYRLDEYTPGGNNGRLTALVSGGVPAYSYDWSHDSTGVLSDSAIADSLAPGMYTLTVTDSTGCTVTDSIEVRDFATRLTSLEVRHLSLYPNPSTGLVQVSLEFPAAVSVRLEVVDLTGRAVWQYQSEQVRQLEQKIDLSGQAAGIYLLRIHGQTGRLSRRILIVP